MSTQVLFVGIGMFHATLGGSFVNAEVRTVRPPTTSRDDSDGRTALSAAIDAACKLVGDTACVVCGMESTSNMHKRLEQALRAEWRCSVVIHVLNPRTVKHFGQARLKDCQTESGRSVAILRPIRTSQSGRTPSGSWLAVDGFSRGNMIAERGEHV